MAKARTVQRVCGTCGREFWAAPSEVNRGGGKYCSVPCALKAPRKHPDFTGGKNPVWRGGEAIRPEQYWSRFWAKILLSRECWLWASWCLPDGRAMFQVGRRKKLRASRVMYELMFGTIPAGMMVCHKCDEPRCVRPDHLFLGTHADNMRDRDRKGRTLKGERQSRARLTVAAVRDIRARVTDGSLMTPLAQKYAVSLSAIWSVVNRKTWAHVA